MTEPPLTGLRLHHLAHTVRDLESSRNFYCSILGFSCIQHYSRPDLQGEALLLQGPGLHLELWHFEGEEQAELTLDRIQDPGLRHLAFETDDIQSSRGRLSDRGVECTPLSRGASGAWYCFFHDPDGLPLELIQPVYTQGEKP